MEFNERLQRLRHREGLTQEELAGRLNVTLCLKAMAFERPIARRA